MRNLIKNEIKIFLNKKFLLAILVCLVSVFYINQSGYVKFFDSYYLSMQAVYKNYQAPLKAAEIRYEVELEAYKNKLNSAKAEEVEKINKIISELNTKKDKYSQLLKLVKALSVNIDVVKDDKFIRSQFALVDKFIGENFIEDIKVNGKDGYLNGYGLNSELDWANRAQERAWRENHEEAISHENITANEAIAYLLDGSSTTYYLLGVFIVLFLNYDIWSRDFLENDGKLIFTLPYKRKKIFSSRFFTRGLFTLLVVLLPLVVLFVYMTIKYESGNTGTVAVSDILLKGKFTNSIIAERFANLDFLSVNKIIPIWQYNLLLVVFYLAWIGLVYSILNFVDIVFETNIVTIMAGLVIIFMTLIAKKVSIFNPASYHSQANILYGLEKTSLYEYEVIKYSYEGYLLATLALTLLLFLLARSVFDRKKI